LIRSLHSRAFTICQERQDLVNEINSLRCDHQLSAYPQGFIDLAINSKGSSHPSKEEKPVGSVYIPYAKGVLEKFEHIGNQYNIKMIFRTKYTLRSSLTKTRLERDLQQMTQCVCSIPCECGRSYVVETGRLPVVWLCEHWHSLKEGLLEKSKLAQHAHEGHRVGWDEARILEIESHVRYRYCMLNQSYQSTQFGHFSHLDPPYQQRGYQLTEKICMP
jgi:hypothetical protein